MAEFNVDDKTIRIGQSKLKLIGLLVITMGFGAAGVWFVEYPENFTNLMFHPMSTFQTVGIGILWILISVISIVVFTIELFNKKPGLIIDDNGITILGLFSSSDIKWCDISKFDVVAISQTPLIYIFLKDTYGYIQRQKSVWKRKMMSFSYKRYGVPLSITTSTLKCDFDELLDLLNTRLADYKRAEKVTHFKEDFG